MSPTPRRVLMVINILAHLGGAEVQLGNLARGMARRGHQVTICCMNDSWIEAEEVRGWGVELVELRRPTRHRRAEALPKLVSLARRADLVHCTMWDSSLWGRAAAIVARKPVIVADHATDRKVQVSAGGAPRANWIALHNRLLDRFTYATVACARAQRATLIGEGVAPERIVYIPNGIPVERLRREAAEGPAREEIGVPAGAPLVVQVGVFRSEKNQLGALEAIAAVREQVPDAHLVFAGAGPTEAGVKQRAEEIGTNGWAHFLGSRSDAAGLMALADLTLLPSISDAMPMTVLESMAVGTPVLATDVGDVKRTLGEAGVCVPAEDTAALASQGVRLLRDGELRAQLGAAGRERALEFDSSAMVDSYESLFEAALAGAPPPAMQ